MMRPSLPKHIQSSTNPSSSKRYVVTLILAVSILFTCLYNEHQIPFVGPHRSLFSSENSNCVWKPPRQDIPNDIAWHKTIVAGYPSRGKNVAITQLEALTGWAATKDFLTLLTDGVTNHPIIKTNYPHHDGVWGFECKKRLYKFFHSIFQS